MWAKEQASGWPGMQPIRRWWIAVATALLLAALLPGCGEGEEEVQQPTPATATPTAHAATPTAVPAGHLGKIAFVHDGDIWVIDLDSDREEQLTTDGQNVRPRWSPDGQWIAFQKTAAIDGGFTAIALWTMREDGSDATLIQVGQTFPPDWSPRENRLAYATLDGGMWLVDPDGGNRLELIPPSGTRDVSGWAWSPDGQRLALERWQRQAAPTPSAAPLEAQGLWLINADGTGLVEVYSAWQPENEGEVVDLHSWSLDGRWLALWQGPWDMTVRTAGLPLLVVPATGGTPQEIAPATLLRQDFAAWSPAGDRVALVEGAGADTALNKQIVVASADGSERYVLSEEEHADLAPAWSPDGQEIAFTSGLAIPPEEAESAYPAILFTRRIRVANADGTNKRQLTDDADYGDNFPQWSADGQHILFVRQQASAFHMEDGTWKAPTELWLMNADGSEQRKVAEGPEVGFGYYGYMDWSQWFDCYR